MDSAKEIRNLKIWIVIIAFLLVLIFLIPLFLSVRSAVTFLDRADHSLEKNRATELLISAISDQAYYRGLGASYLATFEASFRQKLDSSAKTAAKSEAAFNTYLNEHDLLGLSDEEVMLWRNELERWRALDLRDDQVKISEWLDRANAVIRAEEHLIRLLLAPDSTEMLLELLAELEVDSAGIVDYVGLERAKVGVALRQDKPFTLEEFALLEEERGVSIGFAKILKEASTLDALPQNVRITLQQFDNFFFGDYEKLRNQIYQTSIDGDPYPVDFNTWWNLASQAIQSATEVGKAAAQTRQALLQQSRQEARDSVWQTLLYSMFTVLIFSGLIVWLLKNLLSRIVALDKARQELARHRDDLEVICTLRTAEVSSILQTAVNGIVSIDQTGLIRFMNPAALSMFGYCEEEVIGQNVTMLIPPGAHRDQHGDYIQRFLGTGRTNVMGIGREVEACRRDGTTFPIHLAVGHSQPYEDRHMFVAFITDISEQKKTEKELVKSKEEAEAASRTKAAFLANMSHEIRTPMNAVIGFLDVVLDGSLPGEAREHLEIAQNSAHSLMRIINDILDLSKIEEGKIRLESVPFNLPNLAKSVMSTLEHRAREKSIDMAFHYDGELSHCFFGDPNRLRQVLLNLLGNAVKFTEKGCINLTIKRPDDSGNILHFSVQDTGVGIAQESIGKIFQPFTQEDDSTARRFGGTGLGTSISKQIVELMGGEIWVESEEGQGSVFHFTTHMPLADCLDKCIIEGHTIEAPMLFSPRRFRVLIAEDIPENALLAELRLKEQGHEVMCVDNGLQAVKAFRDNPFDLILMDVQMPELDGMESTRRIRQLGGRIPVIALTASVMSDECDRCYKAGMNSVLGKPVNFDELFTEMERLVPDGSGFANDEVNVDIHRPGKTDLSAIESIVDVEKALTLWGDPKMYAQALASFTQRWIRDDAELKVHILSEEPDKARSIAHAIKGVSANLGLIEIERTANDIDRLLKAGRSTKAATLCPALGNAMQEAKYCIDQLNTGWSQVEKSMHTFDRKVVSRLLSNLWKDLDQDDPDVVGPWLRQLTGYLDKEQLGPINKSIENFDFRIAEGQVKALAHQLSLVLE